MLVDFHTHTQASDGALAPQALLQRAEDAGVAMLAITDHDTLAGYLAVAEQQRAPLKLVPGVELSCVWGATTIHVVGLGFNPASASINGAVAQLQQARLERAEKIAHRLEKRGMPSALAGARAIAQSSQLGRPHFARWMVEAGYVSDMNAAFDKYLGQGKLGDVKAYWPPLEAVVRAIVEAGGVAILAHPLKYKFTRMKLNALCEAFKASGGASIEIVNGRQTADETLKLRSLAEKWAFSVSLGSDFHRDWQFGAGLGVDSALAGGLPAVWEHFS